MPTIKRAAKRRQEKAQRKLKRQWSRFDGERFRLYLGDWFHVSKDLEDNSVDSVVVDPPYGLEFMGEDWDTPGAGIEVSAKSAGGFGKDSKTNENAYAAARVRYGRLSAKLWTDRPEKKRRRAAGLNDAFDKALPCYQSGGILLLEWHMAWAREIYRILKPGAYILAFSGTRTYHWLAAALELVGFEAKDQIDWFYFSGFPKNQNVQRAIDMKVCREKGTPGRHYEKNLPKDEDLRPGDHVCPESVEGLAFAGQGTAIKPGHEPIAMMRKPMSEKTIAKNVLKWGTGAVNIDGCRVDRGAGDVPGWHKSGANGSKGYKGTSTFRQRQMSAEEIAERNSGGRWPANVIMTHGPDCTDSECMAGCPVGELEAQCKGASRFFYCPKPSTRERDEGLEQFELQQWVQWQTANGTSKKPSSLSAGRNTKRRNTHPTPKPIELMRYLVRLVTPPGGICLDHFAGSGPVGIACMYEGVYYIGVERKPEFFEFLAARVKHHAEKAFIKRAAQEIEAEARIDHAEAFKKACGGSTVRKSKRRKRLLAKTR